jgi:hypothetical protein
VRVPGEPPVNAARFGVVSVRGGAVRAILAAPRERAGDTDTMRTCLLTLLFAATAALAAGCGSDTYAGCNDISGDDCIFASDRCISVGTSATQGAFCSQLCSFDSQCPISFGFNGACLDVNGSGVDVCYQRCEFESDCFFSSTCIEVQTIVPGLVFSDFVCLPDNGVAF